MIYWYNFHNHASPCLSYKIQLNPIGVSVLHRKHITSPLRAQQVNTIYRCLWRWYININITILYIIQRPVFYLKLIVSEPVFCLRLQVQPTQLSPIDIVSLSPETDSSLRNVVFSIKDKMMAYVQNCDRYKECLIRDNQYLVLD
jgi:hypothetical protein